MTHQQGGGRNTAGLASYFSELNSEVAHITSSAHTPLAIILLLPRRVQGVALCPRENQGLYYSERTGDKDAGGQLAGSATNTHTCLLALCAWWDSSVCFWSSQEAGIHIHRASGRLKEVVKRSRSIVLAQSLQGRWQMHVHWRNSCTRNRGSHLVISSRSCSAAESLHKPGLRPQPSSLRSAPKGQF